MRGVAAAAQSERTAVVSKSVDAAPGAARSKELKGWHVLAIALSAFAVILTANLIMVFSATGSFPGLVEKNSYVASQEFNIRAAAQEKLGWSSALDYEDGRIAVAMTGRDGQAVRDIEVILTIGRPSDARSDKTYQLVWDGEAYAIDQPLEKGVWRAVIVAQGEHAETYHATARFWVR